MSVTFTPLTPTGRYALYRTSHWLTSPGLVGGLLLLLLVCAGSMVMSGMILGSQPFLLGVSVLAGSLAAGLLLAYTFGATYFAHLPTEGTAEELWRRHRAGEAVNLADACSLTALGVLGRVYQMSPTEAAAVLPALCELPGVRRMIDRLSLGSPAEVGTTLAAILGASVDWPTFSEAVLEYVANQRAPVIEPEHVIATVLLQRATHNFLRSNQLRESDIHFVAWWTTHERQVRRRQARWWDPAALLNFTGIGLSWTSGFTPLVDRLSRFPRGNLWDQFLVGREEIIEQLITTLARARQSNVLLVGAAGVGRLGIVQALAGKVTRGVAHPALVGQRVVYLHVGEVIAQAKTAASQIAAVSQVLRELERAGNIIVILDGLGSILAAEGEERLNMTDILLPFFSSLTVRVVVITSPEEYHLRLKSNNELAHFFEVITVESASPEVTLQTLALAVPLLAGRQRMTIPYQTLKAIVESTESILPHIPYPERAFDVLEEAIVVAQAQRLRQVPPSLVEAVITKKVGVPVGQIRERERDVLLNLETVMHQRVVNQTVAIRAVSRALVRARTGVRTLARPIGTFLFLGPTGVGKTETAKALAASYFGSEEAMIRFDMSEFQQADGVATLIGNQNQPVGRLTAAVTDTPFAVVLLDEFEKANAAVHQLFLQVFDEGRLTDARGQTVSFQHTIIIATSNAGAELIRQELRDGTVPDNFDDTLRDYVLRENIFRPELINRFDGVITFTPLSPEHVREVAVLMLRKLNERLDATHGVTVQITPALTEYLLQIGYHPEFGARPMARAIQDTVEYAVAQMILKGVAEPGQSIVLRPDQLAQTQQ